MSMTVNKKKDSKRERFILHRIADIPGGVTVKTALLGGDYLAEGTAIGVADKQMYAVVKTAKIVKELASDAVAIEVSKGHHFRVGDFVMASEKKKSYAITSINTTFADTDIITIGTTLGEKVVVGEYVYEAEGESTATSSSLKYEPQAITGTGCFIDINGNLFVDAWLIGVTTGLPALVAGKLKGIVNV